MGLADIGLHLICIKGFVGLLVFWFMGYWVCELLDLYLSEASVKVSSRSNLFWLFYSLLKVYGGGKL